MSGSLAGVVIVLVLFGFGILASVGGRNVVGSFAAKERGAGANAIILAFSLAVIAVLFLAFFLRPS